MKTMTLTPFHIQSICVIFTFFDVVFFPVTVRSELFIRINPCDDAYIVRSESHWNTGDYKHLEVDSINDRVAYLTFDTSGLSNLEILSVELNLRFYSWTELTGNPDQERSFGTYVVEETSWNEGTLTHSNSPNTADNPTDVMTMLVGYNTQFGWKAWNVTDAWPKDGDLFSLAI